MFGAGLDDDPPTDMDYRSNEVETVRIPLTNHITLPRGNIVQIVMVSTPDGSDSHENDFQLAEANRARTTNEGISTFKKIHRSRRNHLCFDSAYIC